MSYWNAAALSTRMREILEDAAGTLRAIPAGYYAGGLPPGLDVNEESRRAVAISARGAPTEASITRMTRNPSSPPVLGSLAFYNVEVQVRQVYPVVTSSKLDDDTRDGVMALAAKAADVISQAFTFPGNLATTSLGQATGLVTGMFAYVDSDYRWAGSVNTGGMTLEAIHRFRGVIKSTPATS